MNVDRARPALSALRASRALRRTGAPPARRRLGAIAAALALGATLAVAGAAAPASAHHNTIQGRFDCVAGDATGTVSWTVENSEGIVETVTESSSPTVVPVGTKIAGRATATFVQHDVAPGTTVELAISAQWSNGATHRDTGRLEVIAGSCDAEPPASLTGAVAVGECEADVPWIEYRVALDDPRGIETARDVQLVLFEGDDEAWIDLGRLGDDLAASGRVLWPGATVDEHGAPTGWPGWERDAAGEWVETDGNFAWTRDVEHAAIVLMPDTASAGAVAVPSGVLAVAPEDEPVALAPVVIAYPGPTDDCTAAPALGGGGTGNAPTAGGPLASTGGGTGAGTGLAETGFSGTPFVIAAVVIVALGAALLVMVRLRRRPAAADAATTDAGPDSGAADRDA